MTKTTNLNSLIRKSTVATLCAVSVLGGSTSTVSAGVAKPLAEVNSLALVNTNNGLDDREPGWINRYGAGVSFDQAQDIYYKPTALPPNFDTSTLDQINIDIATDVLTHLGKGGIDFKSTSATTDIVSRDCIPLVTECAANIQTRAFFHDFGPGSANAIRFELNDRVSQYLESLGAEVVSGPNVKPSVARGEAFVSPIEGAMFKITWVYAVPGPGDPQGVAGPQDNAQFSIQIDSAPSTQPIDTSRDVTEPIVVTSR